jgi:hypothetical protein
LAGANDAALTHDDNMPDFIGNIAVPKIATSGTFPVIPEYPYGRASHPDVAIHQFGSGNAKIEQRFPLGTGARRFTVRRAWMNDTQRLARRNFWETKYGPYGAFTDLWASLDAAIDRDTDPVTEACTMTPATSKVCRVGDCIIFNLESKSPDVGYRRCYECAQIVGPGSIGDVVPSGNFQFQRKPTTDTRMEWPWASFETLRTPHQKGIRFFKLDSKTFTYSVKKGFFRTPGLPVRIEAKLPTAAIVAAVVGVANNFGYGAYTTFPCSHHSEPFMPGDRTCNGGAYSFQVPGPLAVADTVVITMRVHDSASIRCLFAHVQTATTDGLPRDVLARKPLQIPNTTVL